MASTTYTQPLWNANIGATGVLLGPTVPLGQLWVVRDVTMWLFSTYPAMNHGDCLLQEKTFNTVLWGVSYLDATPGRVFHAELRQALVGGNQLQIRATSSGWTVAVTGYVFTAP